jgi:hypothetical protein
MGPEDMLGMSGATAIPDALGSLQRSGRQIVAIDSPSATSGLISVDALAQGARLGRGQISELVDTASIVVRQEAVPLISPSWMSSVGVIRIAAPPSAPALTCPISHKICKCDGVCLNI